MKILLLGATGRTVGCIYEHTDGVCSDENYTCLATLSTYGDNQTNLHIADCTTDPYRTSVCCKITNLPTVQNITITSDATYGADYGNLTGNFDYFDGDEDEQQDNQTAWFKNGAEQTTLRNLTWISSGNNTQGDEWIFSARAYDGNGWGLWVNSSVFTINTEPQSSASVSSDDSLNRTEGNLTGTIGIVVILQIQLRSLMYPEGYCYFMVFFWFFFCFFLSMGF